MKSDELSFLLGVLDDYSNRYMGFGALFAASLFGMYALMGLDAEKIPNLMMWGIYIVLYGAGFFLIIFTYRYTRLTAEITSYIINASGAFEKAFTEAVRRNDVNLLRSFTEWLYGNLNFVFLLLIIIYSFITWGPFLYVIGYCQ